MGLKRVCNFFHLYLDIILLIASLVFFVMGLVNLVPFPQYKEFGSYSGLVFYETVYSLCFVFCAIFFVMGLALRLELFEGKVRERKLANLLICVSIPLLIGSFVLGMFRVVVGEKPCEVYFQVGKEVKSLLLHQLLYDFPFSQFSSVLVVIGICCLFLGLILRLRS